MCAIPYHLFGLGGERWCLLILSFHSYITFDMVCTYICPILILYICPSFLFINENDSAFWPDLTLVLLLHIYSLYNINRKSKIVGCFHYSMAPHLFYHTLSHTPHHTTATTYNTHTHLTLASTEAIYIYISTHNKPMLLYSPQFSSGTTFRSIATLLLVIPATCN